MTSNFGTCIRAVLGVGAALLIAGCAALSPPSVSRDSGGDGPLSGRISVRVEGPSPKSVAAVFDLQGDATKGTLGLSTPLGSMLAQANWAPGLVTMTTPQGQTAYADLDSLTREVLGESVPVAALFDWLRARPWPAATSRSLAAPDRGFEQLGWTVRLDRFDAGFVDAQRSATPPVAVRIRLD
ncbi:hypothetical protein BH09PSE5_BH09PSE5_23180 [soil metagenome]